MTYKTHILAAITASTVLCALNKDFNLISCSIFSSIGALLPDLDHPKAILNSRAKSCSVLTNFSHRTFTHSLLFASLAWFVAYSMSLSHTTAISVLIGTLSHLGADMLNKQGVPLLYPFFGRVSLSKIRVGGIGEFAFSCVMIAIVYVVLRA